MGLECFQPTHNRAEHGGVMMKIYVASSWRNYLQPAIVSLLRKGGHEVYDFRNPPDRSGFAWSSIDEHWKDWTPDEYRKALEHPIARAGFDSDMNALRSCDACVLVLPSGRSASFEFGWAIGNGKQGAVVQMEKCEPELMYLGNPILTTTDEVMDWAGIPVDRIDGLCKGTVAITEKDATSLADNLGGSFDFWMNRERRYQEDLKRLGLSRPVASTRSVTFEGTISGDMECFCWDEVAGCPDSLSDFMHRVYPEGVVRHLGCKEGKRYRFTVSVEEVDDGK